MMIPDSMYIEAAGLQFWIDVSVQYHVDDIIYCQEIINKLKKHLSNISDDTIEENEILEDIEDMSEKHDTKVLILALGMIFWRSTVKHQNIQDMKHCNVIINYLNQYLEDHMNVGKKMITRECRVMIERLGNGVKDDPFYEPETIITKEEVDSDSNFDDFNDNDVQDDDEEKDFEFNDSKVKSISILKQEKSDVDYVGFTKPEDTEGQGKNGKQATTCKYCLTVFESIFRASQHTSEVHKDKVEEFDREYKTKKCTHGCTDKSFYTYKGLHKHIREVHKLRIKHKKFTSEQCGDCGMVLTNRSDYQDHLEEHKQGLGTPLFHCTAAECRKKFHFRRKLNSHLHQCKKLKREQNPQEYNNLCSYCGKGFTTPNRLDAHKIRYHESAPKQPKPRTCETCGETFEKASAYLNHAYKVHARNAIYCEICFKKVRSSNHLERHMAAHSIKNIQCQQCDKKFASELFLDRHIKTVHVTEASKKHVCGECGKGFNDRMRFDIHMNIHLGIRPHACDICQHAFSDPSNLRQHQRRVHKVK